MDHGLFVHILIVSCDYFAVLPSKSEIVKFTITVVYHCPALLTMYRILYLVFRHNPWLILFSFEIHRLRYNECTVTEIKIKQLGYIFNGLCLVTNEMIKFNDG